MLGKLREMGKMFQAKYEGLIASRSLFGFSDAYANAIKEIEEKRHRGAA